ncbi:MAG: NADH-quinone oxidoreductase subunit NuoN [Aquisalinus sp.]|nr:NADH-quinone oxidoreductase subunit NuoN [Aquisalinus sp.]
MTLLENVSFAVPEIFIAIATMGLLMFGVFTNGKYARELNWGAIAVLLLALYPLFFGTASQPASIFNNAFSTDGFAKFSKAVIYIGAIFSILLSGHFMEREKINRFEYPILILTSVLGMSLMVSSTDLISLYLGIELQSLSLYILASFNRDSRRSTEAGLKYFVLGALSSCLLLYGASLVYGFTGATTFPAIAEAGLTANTAGLILGLVFLISGLAFKVSAAPFHMWTPDVYEGSPTPVTAFFAAAPKFAGMALFARLMVEAFPGIIDQWQPVVIMISILSMAIGAFSAIAQTNIKRLMAYSSIGHMGYALMGVAAGTEQGISSVLIYMSIYMIMTLGTFGCILAMRRPEGMAENISDLAGLSRTQPGLAVMFTVFFFSLMGIPPLAGFFAKFYVFIAAIDAGLYPLAIAGALASAVAAYYYLSVIIKIWVSEPAPEFERQVGQSVKGIAVAASVLMVVGIFTIVPVLNTYASAAAETLFR